MVVLARWSQRRFGHNVYIPRCIVRGFQTWRTDITRTAALCIIFWVSPNGLVKIHMGFEIYETGRKK